MKFLFFVVCSALLATSAYSTASNKNLDSARRMSEMFRMGPNIQLEPINLEYNVGAVVPAYPNPTENDVKQSEIVHDRIKKLWKENGPKYDPIEEDAVEVNLLNYVCDGLYDSWPHFYSKKIQLLDTVLTGLSSTKIHHPVVRTEYPLQTQRLDVNITVPRVKLYTRVDVNVLNIKALELVVELNDMHLQIAAELNVLFRAREADLYDYRISAVNAHVNVPVVKVKLETNPEDTAIENNKVLIQLAAKLIQQDVADQIGHQVLSIINDLITAPRN